MNSLERFNRTIEALERLAGREHAIGRLRSYANRMPATLSDLRDAVERRDREAARAVSITLRDRSEELGIGRIAMMAQILDGWAGVAAWIDATETVDLLEREVSEWLPVLEHVVQRLCSPESKA